MKKSVMISLIVAVSLLLAGSILATIGLAIGNISPATGQSGAISYVEEIYVTDATGITRLLAESSNHSIKVLPVDGNEIRITYYVNDFESYEIQNENGYLTLQHIVKKHWPVFSGFNLDLRDTSVIIELPAVYLGSLNLKTSNARISLENLKFKGPVEAITSNASVSAQNLISGDEINLKTSNGRIEMANIEAARVVGKTSNTNLDADQIHTSYLELVSSNGSIQASAVQSDEIILNTSNGKIYGTIIGNSQEYQIQSHTSNAKNSLENLGGSGPHKLTVKTSNGSIGLKFTGS